MRSGKLDRRIALQVRTTSRDRFGEEIETWTFAANLWAEKEHRRTTERYADQQRYATAELVFRVRWFPLAETVAENFKDYRILYKSREYNLLGLEEIGRKEGAHIVCKSRADMGGSV